MFGGTSDNDSGDLFHNLGLGYAIAITLGFLLLLSTILLASYICCSRSSSHNPNQSSSNNNNTSTSTNTNLDIVSGTSTSTSNDVVLPHIIFVDDARDDDDDSGGVVGLDPAVIRTYPKFAFSRTKARSGGGGSDTTCAICLCDYRDGEMLRMLPDCRHFFHLSCVDGWLRLNASCPVCRTSPLPTPLSTPLSELVPLSQFSADRRRR